MAGLDPATQPPRVRAANEAFEFFCAPTRAHWVGGSAAAHGEKRTGALMTDDHVFMNPPPPCGEVDARKRVGRGARS